MLIFLIKNLRIKNTEPLLPALPRLSFSLACGVCVFQLLVERFLPSCFSGIYRCNDLVLFSKSVVHPSRIANYISLGLLWHP